MKHSPQLNVPVLCAFLGLMAILATVFYIIGRGAERILTGGC